LPYFARLDAREELDKSGDAGDVPHEIVSDDQAGFSFDHR
jgi:hypothetical protein